MKILISVEDTVYGAHIADLVLAHKWSENLEFKVLYSVEPMHVGYYCDPRTEEKHWDWAKKLVGAVAQRLKEGFPKAHVEEVVVSGKAKEEILRIGKEWDCDLIIVGSHGRRGLTRILLGSVSMAVLSQATCSVMVARLPTGKGQAQKGPAVDVDLAVQFN